MTDEDELQRLREWEPVARAMFEDAVRSRDEARAEVDRWKSAWQRSDRAWAANEAALARVRALADEWENCYDPSGESLNAVLAAAPSASDPVPERRSKGRIVGTVEPAEFFRYPVEYGADPMVAIIRREAAEMGVEREFPAPVPGGADEAHTQDGDQR